MAFFMPVSRRLATRLAAPSQACRQCLKQFPPTQRVRSAVLDAVRQTRAPFAQQIRFQSTTNGTVAAAAKQAKVASEASTKAYAEALENAPTKKKTPEFTSSKAVGLWLIGSAVSVFGIIVFGGLTRLTESG
jgi:cytochrome c oxidase assembly protein subunit 15